MDTMKFEIQVWGGESVIELDSEAEVDMLFRIQAALMDVSGPATAPQMFVRRQAEK